jgi:hypothetical protein
MHHFDDRILNEALTDQLDLDFGDNGAWVPPGRDPAAEAAADDDFAPRDPHYIGCVRIAGRRYELDCRIDRATRVVLGYALRPVPSRRAPSPDLSGAGAAGSLPRIAMITTAIGRAIAHAPLMPCAFTCEVTP